MLIIYGEHHLDKLMIFSIIKTISNFYQEVLIAFNKAKYINPFYLLNKHDIIEQPIWGSEYFKKQQTCIWL